MGQQFVTKSDLTLTAMRSPRIKAQELARAIEGDLSKLQASMEADMTKVKHELEKTTVQNSDFLCCTTLANTTQWLSNTNAQLRSFETKVGLRKTVSDIWANYATDSELTTRMSRMEMRLRKYETKDAAKMAISHINHTLTSLATKDAVMQAKASILDLTGQLDVAASTANTALTAAHKGAQSMKSVCFMKLVGADCPLGTSKYTLWHWYLPESNDPWCGFGTENSGDGVCTRDWADNQYNKMFGCCT